MKPLPMNSSSSKKRKQHARRFNQLMAFLTRAPRNKEQLMQLLREAENRDVLSTEMLGMIERILQVAEMQVREVMVPKAQMVVVEKTHCLEELLSIAIESGHSRFPVADSTKQDIIGILLAKDLLKYVYPANNTGFNIANLIRPAIFTSQSKRLNILLREFRVNRNHMAIVVDEYGHVAGLFTIEDVLEQIVGEIEDEYDIEDEESHIKKLSDDTYIIKASTTIAEFNDYFHAQFSDATFDTIGGIVLKAFEHLPARGETINIQPWRFKVLHSDNRRIYLLEMKTLKTKHK